MDFEKHFEGTETIFLNQNYRSTKNILNGANSVIAYNRNRLEKICLQKTFQGRKLYILLLQVLNQKLNL